MDVPSAAETIAPEGKETSETAARFQDKRLKSGGFSPSTTFQRKEMIMFDQITLPNGLRVVGEKLGHIHSCTVGVWVKVGSVNDCPKKTA